MNIVKSKNKEQLGKQAAKDGLKKIREAVTNKGSANIILATGASQFATMEAVAADTSVDWSKVTCFHLDEYVALTEDHPASFRGYLRDRFHRKTTPEVAAFHYINGEGDLAAECRRLGDLIREVEIDVAFIGIGENAHLAFNDPPADFETKSPYIVVDLDLACRKQQLGEGWFPSLIDVPMQAISMSVHWILKSKSIICSVPDERKAAAVLGAIEGPITPACPASALQKHADTTIYLDRGSASMLT
jgi:glucosamine-6-phosphate deaminase